jgi:hypothetical protein
MKSKPGHIVGEDKIASSDRGRGWGMVYGPIFRPLQVE